MNDSVQHPSHYNQGSIECIEAMESAYGINAVINFCLCNAFKYVWRAQHKNGVEDIKKAKWYLEKIIDILEVEDEPIVPDEIRPDNIDGEPEASSTDSTDPESSV